MNMTLDEALEYAAKHLHEGAEVNICVENGAAIVTVCDWDGNWRDESEFDSADMTIPEQVVDCVKWANEQPQPPNA
jgi:cupin superfamily acireductone dioxygenase involved in methionine salvage